MGRVCAPLVLEAVKLGFIRTPQTCKGFCSRRTLASRSSRVKGSRLVLKDLCLNWKESSLQKPPGCHTLLPEQENPHSTERRRLPSVPGQKLDCAGTLGCTRLARQQDAQWQEGQMPSEASDGLQTLYSYIKFSVMLYVVALSSLVIYKYVKFFKYCF